MLVRAGVRADPGASWLVSTCVPRPAQRPSPAAAPEKLFWVPHYASCPQSVMVIVWEVRPEPLPAQRRQTGVGSRAGVCRAPLPPP